VILAHDLECHTSSLTVVTASPKHAEIKGCRGSRPTSAVALAVSPPTAVSRAVVTAHDEPSLQQRNAYRIPAKPDFRANLCQRNPSPVPTSSRAQKEVAGTEKPPASERSSDAARSTATYSGSP
jgi:hypothetical protein